MYKQASLDKLASAVNSYLTGRQRNQQIIAGNIAKAASLDSNITAFLSELSSGIKKQAGINEILQSLGLASAPEPTMQDKIMNMIGIGKDNQSLTQQATNALGYALPIAAAGGLALNTDNPLTRALVANDEYGADRSYRQQVPELYANLEGLSAKGKQVTGPEIDAVFAGRDRSLNDLRTAADARNLLPMLEEGRLNLAARQEARANFIDKQEKRNAFKEEALRNAMSSLAGANRNAFLEQQPRIEARNAFKEEALRNAMRGLAGANRNAFLQKQLQYSDSAQPQRKGVANPIIGIN